MPAEPSISTTVVEEQGIFVLILAWNVLDQLPWEELLVLEQEKTNLETLRMDTATVLRSVTYIILHQ